MTEIRPPDVPGFDQHVAAGGVAAIPSQPPRPLPGRTAGTAARRVFHLLVAAIALYVVLFEGLGAAGASGTARILLPGLAAGLAFWWLYREWLRAGERKLEELAHGYTTLTLTTGAFRQEERRRWAGSGDRAAWDYRGVWVLSRDGDTVLQSPDRDVLPPGFYPSPHRNGMLELWTGAVWLPDYRAPGR